MTTASLPARAFVLTSTVGLPEMLLSTPTFKALKEAFPGCSITLYVTSVTHAKLLEYNPSVDRVRLLRTKWGRVCLALSKLLARWTGAQHCSLAFQRRIAPGWISNASVVDHIAELFSLQLSDRRVQLFLRPEEEERARKRLEGFTKEVVLLDAHCRSSINRVWENSRWEELVRRMPDYVFVQTGGSRDPLINGAIDWRGKLIFRELAAVLKFSTSFVGVDSTLSHVANAFDVPGVVIWGDSSPQFWGHETNINLYKAPPCSPCSYMLEPDGLCPYAKECFTSISVAEVEAALRTQLMAGRARRERLGLAKTNLPGVLV